MPRPVIGVDIGHSAVRAVALIRSKAGWTVASHAELPRRDASGEARPLPVLLSELDNLIGLRRGEVTIADSAHTILVRFVSTIPMPPERMAKLLRLELAQHADQSGGELAADTYQVPLAGDELIHGCAMAQPPAIHTFLGELAQANVVPRRVHVAAAALFNATLAKPPVQGDDFALMVDIGAATTRVALVGEGRLLAFRQLAVGGDAFTAAIAEARSIPVAKAEQLKLHWALAQAEERARDGAVGFEKRATLAGSAILAPADAAPSAVTVVDEPAGERHATDDDTFNLVIEDDAPPAALPDAAPGAAGFDAMLDEGLDQPGAQTMAIGGATLGIEMMRTAEALYTQLSSTVAWFRAQLQMDRPRITKVLLSGGGAELTGLESYLQRRFDLPVERFDPCAGLGGALPDAPHTFATAIGLALAEAPEGVRLDVLPESLVRRRLWRERLVWPYVAAAALLVAAVLGAWTLFNERGVHEESLGRLRAHQAEREQLTATLAALQQDKDLLAEDLKAIASRIYFNRDLLYVIRVMKEQAPKNSELWVTRLETVKLDPPRPDPGAKPAGRAKPDPTVVDRGAIEIEGRVKFDRTLTPDELKKFFEDYMTAIENSVAGAAGANLFDQRRTFVFKHWMVEDKPAPGATQPKGQPAAPATDGSFPFGIRLVFTPTQLGQATAPVEGGR